MAKDTISQYSKTAGSNTDVQSVSIAEGMAPSDVNNAMREVMVDLASLYDGTQSLATLKTTTALSAANGTVSAPSLQATADTNTGVYFPAADTVGVVAGGTEQFRFGSNPIPGGSKNLVMNGAMTVNQRGISALALDGANQYTVDRWRVQEATSAGVIQVNQSTTVPAGAGFASSLHIDVTTADTSLAAGDFVLIYQTMEAQNSQHLAYGNAAAKTLSLSFWVRSPKSGTHAVGIYQNDGGRHYIREYTVTSADTYEYITVTFPGDASGTINNDTGAGLDVYFGLATGSTYQNTADTWAAGQDWSTSSAVNCMDNAANNFYLTGVQLEVGSVATDFAHEDYGTTLKKCQRYYFDWTATTSSEVYTMGEADNTTQLISQFQYLTTMRAAPTFTAATASYWNLAGKGTAISCTAVEGDRLTINGCRLVYTVSSGLTAGEAWIAQRNATDAAVLTWSAEL